MHAGWGRERAFPHFCLGALKLSIKGTIDMLRKEHAMQYLEEVDCDVYKSLSLLPYPMSYMKQVRSGSMYYMVCALCNRVRPMAI